MKKSTNRKRTSRIILQSLPAVPVAIVVVIYVMSLMPRSTKKWNAGLR